MKQELNKIKQMIIQLIVNKLQKISAIKVKMNNKWRQYKNS